MIKNLQELLNAPHEIKVLCETIDLNAKEAIKLINKNGVVLDPLRPKKHK